MTGVQTCALPISNSLYEVDDYAWYHGGRNLFDASTFGNGVTKLFPLRTIATAKTNGSLTVVLSANNALTATVTLNDEEIGMLATTKGTEYDYAKTVSRTFAVSNITDYNTVAIRQNGDGDMRLDHISISIDDIPAEPDLGATQFPAAEYEGSVAAQNLHADENIDMVIVIPRSRKWENEAERLKLLHEQNDGLRVRIVAEDELWNEFSSGDRKSVV